MTFDFNVDPDRTDSFDRMRRNAQRNGWNMNYHTRSDAYANNVRDLTLFGIGFIAGSYVTFKIMKFFNSIKKSGKNEEKSAGNGKTADADIILDSSMYRIVDDRSST